MAEGLRIRHEAGVATATLARGSGNLLTEDICRALRQLLLQPPHDLHVLHLRAEGPAFCLGRERTAEDPAALRGEVGALVGLNRAFGVSRLVSVAEIQGDAAGIGVGLPALCDVAIAAESALFWFPEVEIDLAPTVVLSWLPAIVGPKRAFHLTATGERFGAAVAADLGLLTRAVPDASLAATVREEISRLRQFSPRVHAQIKGFLADTAGLDQGQAYALATERLILGSMARRR
ncbi:enoyl-CoA hydratase/isomerase family protein [Egicoccus sp. AB-alg6-2]|uniref:enoyl-CoA hydratase/isomerase family protein n=1 Tax=Egicoccus sp. AB-alg6-2 TaxID=3242692 RepID=UPI00359DBC5C